MVASRSLAVGATSPGWHTNISNAGIVTAAGSYTFINTWARIGGRWRLMGSGLSARDGGSVGIDGRQPVGGAAGPIARDAAD